MIAPMIPGNALAAFTPNLPSSNAKALNLFLTHSFKPFSSLGGDVPPPPPGSNASTSTPIAFPNSREYGSNGNALLSKQHPYLFSQ